MVSLLGFHVLNKRRWCRKINLKRVKKNRRVRAMRRDSIYLLAWLIIGWCNWKYIVYSSYVHVAHRCKWNGERWVCHWLHIFFQRNFLLISFFIFSFSSSFYYWASPTTNSIFNAVHFPLLLFCIFCRRRFAVSWGFCPSNETLRIRKQWNKR